MPKLPDSYYNRYDRNNNYKKHIFRAGKGFQSAEANEIHSFIHDNFQRYIEDTVGDGSVISGGGIRISGDNSSVRMESGDFIAGGYIIGVDYRDIPISNSGKFVIGVGVKKTVITELQDPSFRDPAVSTRNFNSPGAARLKITGEWLKEDEVSDEYDFYPIHTIIDGSLVTETAEVDRIEESPLIETIARYDRDSSGNYVVEGLGVQYDVDDIDTQEHIMIMSPGVAHVYGFEVKYEQDVHFRVPFALDELFTNNEPHQFTGDGSYSLRNIPISRLNEVFGVREITEEVVHGPYSGVSDEMPHTPVVDILHVEQSGTVYEEGVDYVQDGNEIDWSLSGIEPAPGSTYVVTYTYTDEITSSVTISEDRQTINISGLKNDTTLYVDYHYFVPRWDKILLDRYGNIERIKGSPHEIDNIKQPKNTKGLSIANILVQYGKEPEVEMDYYRAFKMKDIQSLQDQIKELQYNFTRLSQMQDIGAKDQTTDKTNMFVDPFLDNDLRDKGLNNNAIIMDGILTPGMNWKSKVIREGNDITLPGTEIAKLVQDSYSKDRLVNEFDYTEIETDIKVTPKSKRWLSDTTGTNKDPDIVIDEDAKIPTDTVLTITGGKYASNEAVNIFIDDTYAATTEANNEGKIDKSFNVPQGVKSGTKVVSAVGMKTNALGTDTFIAKGVLQRTAIKVKHHHHQHRTVNKITKNIIQKGINKVPVNTFDRRYGELPSDLQDKIRKILNTGYGKPPDPKQMYNNWNRFAHKDDQQPSASLDKWTYNTNKDRVECTNNLVHHLYGYYSNKNYNRMILECSLGSTSGDDDAIGVLIAFAVVGGKEYTLSAMRNAGGHPDFYYQVIYNANQPDEKVIADGDNLVTQRDDGWNDLGETKMRVIRDGDTFNIKTSDHGSSQIDDSTELTVDLNSDSDLDKFKGKAPFGFCCWSQRDSYMDNIKWGDTQRLWDHYQNCVNKGNSLQHCVRHDPLAQTFRFENNAMLSSVEIFVTEKDQNDDEIIETAIHSTTVGMPERDNILASVKKNFGEIVEGAWNKFELERPLMLDGEEEFALVVFTPSVDTKIRVAELGAYDLEYGRWISNNPYGIGVLQQSANRSTWSALPKEDMTFKLNTMEFQSENEMLLGTVKVTDATDLNFTVVSDLFEKTNYSFKAVLKDENDKEFALDPGKTTKIPKYTGDIEVYATLSTENKNLSPLIDGNCTITVGKVVFPAYYHSREFQIDGNSMRVWLDIYEPLGTSVKVYYLSGSDPFDESSWTELTRNTSASKEIGDGWKDMYYESSDVSGISGTRLRIILNSDDETLMRRPFAENLRAYVSV